MGNLRWLDVTVIAAYLATPARIGPRFSRRQTSTERYFIARRSIPECGYGRFAARQLHVTSVLPNSDAPAHAKARAEKAVRTVVSLAYNCSS
jgi:hypothetical protein